MGNPSDLGSSWLTTDGEVINPDAPAGGGGVGRFRTAGPLGADEPFSPALPAPDAPVARYLVTPDPDPLQAGGIPAKPPPPTQVNVVPMKPLQDDENDVDVQIETLADTSSDKPADSAETFVDPSKLQFEAPKVILVGGKVTKFTSKLLLKGKVTIQVHYKKNPPARATDRSRYGRGTTDEDKAKGNVTVGFHESCHLADHLKWLTGQDLPKNEFKLGMSKAEYSQAVDKFRADMAAFFKADSANSVKLTDETGDPTLSKWIALGKP